MKRYHILTFGCQMNKSDSERIAAKLEELGYESASDQKEADLVVVNMCSVRQSAVDRVYGRIQRIRSQKDSSSKKFLLTGCILKKDLKRFKKEFDYLLSIKTLPYWEQALQKEQYHYYPDPRGDLFSEKFKIEYLDTKPRYDKGFSAYIPIATGCDNFCTYCVVPLVRGPMICRPPEEIIEEARTLVQKGTKEIWLIASNVNSYRYENVDFADLLKKTDSVPGDFWINFTSSHPKDFNPKLIKTIKTGEKISRYVSLPVQSGDDEILKRMNRPYTVEDYKQLVLSIRREIPDLHISTDVIVGFPGETKKQFRNTVELFKELRFDMAYIAEYSPRPHTKADQLEDDVPPEEKQRRREVLTEVLKKIVLEKNREYVGKEVEVLVFRSQKKALVGKTQNYKTVKITKFPSQEKMIGKRVKVKIIDAIPWGLEGVAE